jgi:hypothetical protein
LVVTFAEAYGFPIYHVWAGPLVKRAYVSSYPYTHYSVLSTIESNWNLAPLTTNDRDAAHMGEFFLGQPSRGLNAPPPHPLWAGYVLAVSATGGIGVLFASVVLLRRERRRSLGPEGSDPPRRERS